MSVGMADDGRSRLQNGWMTGMARSSFMIALNRGNLMRRGIATKGVLLSRAQRAGIAVPPSMILLDEAWQFARQHDMLAGPTDVLVPRDIGAFMNALKIFPGLTELGARVAVRGLYTAENEPALRLQGISASKLRVDRRDPQALATAICTVWSAADRFSRVQRRDLLLMTMVEPQHAGVAVLESIYEDDVVNFTGGSADPLVQGRATGVSIQLPRLRHREPAQAKLPFAQRLQALIRQVRRVFGDADWELEWADDGTTCWLVQIRPLQHPLRRDDHFAGGVLQALMPAHMSYFMSQLYEDIGAEMFQYFRRFDTTLPESRAYIQLFAGQPRYNYSLLADMLRRWGLPGIIMADLNNATFLMVNTQSPRLWRSWWRIIRLAIDTLFQPRRQLRHFDQLYRRVQRFHSNLDEMIMILRDVMVVLHNSVAATQRIIGPLEHWLRRRRAYAAWISHYPTLTWRMRQDLAPIRAYVEQRPDIADQIKAHMLPSDAVFMGMWEEVMSRHGFRAVFEGDIATPRFREDASVLKHALFTPSTEAAPTAIPFKLWPTWPVWLVLRWGLSQRDALVTAAMTVVDRIRRILIQQAERATERGYLPSADVIWYLSPSEYVQACEGTKVSRALIIARQQLQQELAPLHVPLHVSRFEDPLTWHESQSHMRVILRGSGVTSGVVQGRAWRPANPNAHPPGDIPQHERVLVVRHFDAQWVPAVLQCSAIVVETGADLSNGAMILRTLGLPAVIAVRGGYDSMPTGTELVVAASYAYVELRGVLPNALPAPADMPLLPELGVTRSLRALGSGGDS